MNEDRFGILGTIVLTTLAFGCTQDSAFRHPQNQSASVLIDVYDRSTAFFTIGTDRPPAEIGMHEYRILCSTNEYATDVALSLRSEEGGRILAETCIEHSDRTEATLTITFHVPEVVPERKVALAAEGWSIGQGNGVERLPAAEGASTTYWLLALPSDVELPYSIALPLRKKEGWGGYPPDSVYGKWRRSISPILITPTAQPDIRSAQDQGRENE